MFDFGLYTPGPLGTKSYSNGVSHIPKMATMPVYGKNLKNLLLPNQKTIDLKTLYVLLWTWVLPKWSWVDLDLFYAKVKFGHIGFCVGEREIIYFLETIAALGLKVAWSI